MNTPSSDGGDPRSATRVDVYKDLGQVGELARTEHGASFQYAQSYAEQHAGDPLRAVAFSLPVRREPYQVFGSNLHPFFAGLLPEGLRLRVLVRTLKTSEDDLFSLLSVSGADTVGDIAVARPGQRPAEHAPLADIAQLPTLSFDELFEQSLRYEGEHSDATIAGVQPKLSAAMISFPLRAKHRRRAYLLKLTPPEYPRLAENEAFFMSLARSCGLQVARCQLVHDRTGRSGLLVERFDRLARADGSLARLHQEDACQLLNLYPADKYRVSLADVARALEVCSAPLPERLKLVRLQALAYLVANGDMHAKNISVQVLEGRIVMTPVYDFLSTLPYGDQSLALAMEGRDARLKLAHFVAFGERVGLRRAAVEPALRALTSKVAPYLPRLSEIGLEPKKLAHLERVIRERLADLGS